MGGPQARFVGRVQELRTLSELGAVLDEGKGPATALIVGEPGIGKTRLLTESAALVGAQHHFHVAAYEPEKGVPLAAAAGLLRELRSMDREGRRLSALAFDASDPITTLGPVRIFEACYRCISELGRTLITIDDLQWLDELSLALCHYLLTAATSEALPIALIAASRPSAEALSFSGSLDHSSEIAGTFRALQLHPLTPEESASLARGLDPSIETTEALRLSQASAGNPFWLQLLVRGGEQSLDRVAASRLSAAGADAGELTALLAVSGRPMTAAEMADALGWPLSRVEEGTTRLVGRGIAIHTGMLIAFAHDLLRTAALRQLPETEKSRMHRALGTMLEDRAGEETLPLFQALVHREAAGAPTADLAIRLLDPRHRRLLGSHQLHSLARIVDKERSVTPSERIALSRALASAASDLGEHRLAQERWAGLIDDLEDDLDRAEAGLASARAAFELGRRTEVVSILERCRKLAPNDPIVQVEADVQEALVLRWMDHETHRAHRLTKSALERIRPLATANSKRESFQPRARSAYLSALRAGFDAALNAEEVDEMVSIGEELTAAGSGPEEQSLRDLVTWGLLLRQLSRLEEAETSLNRAWREAERSVFPRIGAEAGLWLAATLFDRGRMEEAGAIILEALQLARRAGTPTRMSLTWAEGMSCLVEGSRRNWTEPLKTLSELVDREGDPHYRMMLRHWLGVWTARHRGGRAAEFVKAQLDAGRRDAEAARCDRCRWEMELRMSEALVRAGLSEEAHRALSAWEEAHPHPTVVQDLGKRYATALAADPRRRTSSLRELGVLAAEVGLVHEQLWLAMDLGDALRAEGRRDEAVEVLLEVTRDAEEGGIGSVADKARELLRSLGVRTWRRSSSTEGLTRREREVAELAAEGASNPEIAEILFLSRKTVERHLSNIFTKLEIKNRVQLAGKMHFSAGDPGGESRVRDLPDERERTDS